MDSCVISILWIQAEAALTREEPVLGELLLPGLGVQHGVDVADPRLPRAPHLLLHHHPQLPALEHHGGIGGAGVVQLAGKQVQSNSERLTRNRTAKTRLDLVVSSS